MAVCSKCGVEITNGAKFCKSCGSNLERRVQDEKKARVLAGEKKRPHAAIVVAAAVVIVVAGWLVYGKVSRARSMDRPQQGSASREGNRHLRYTAIKGENGQVTVPLDALQGSDASYFVYNANGKDVRFFILRASDGTIRAALDACQACYHAKLGYRQNGDSLVCNNCGMSFKSTDVGHVTGGCSPIPLKNTQDGKMLVVKVQDLESGVKYF